MEKIFALIQRYSFQGHTHVPGVFTEDCRFLSPDEIDYQYRLGDQKAMVNVGSVGQPRDGDPRACYVILEDGYGTSPPAGVPSPVLREDNPAALGPLPPD